MFFRPSRCLRPKAPWPTMMIFIAISVDYRFETRPALAPIGASLRWFPGTEVRFELVRVLFERSRLAQRPKAANPLTDAARRPWRRSKKRLLEAHAMAQRAESMSLRTDFSLLIDGEL